MSRALPRDPESISDRFNASLESVFLLLLLLNGSYSTDRIKQIMFPDSPQKILNQNKTRKNPSKKKVKLANQHSKEAKNKNKPTRGKTIPGIHHGIVGVQLTGFRAGTASVE